MIRSIFAVAALALLSLPARAVEIQEVTSPGGVAFWLVEEPAIPIVSVDISFAGGARLDPADRTGLARMTMALLDEGAGELDSVAFVKERDRLAARYGFSAGRDTVEVSATMLAEEAGPSAALLATALTEPRFDADAVERIRGQILSGLAADETSPRTVASRAWFARAFPDHPYGRPTDGVADTVRAITVEDLRDARTRLLTRANATVAVVGAIDPAAAGRLIDTILGGLDEGTPVVAPEEMGAPPAGTEVISLPVPQSVAIFGQAGIAREDPDFFPAFVMNYILGGGGFSSRLMEEVRAKRGLAYGVYSYLSDLDAANLYLGSVQTANERVAESLEVIQAEWRRMAEEGVSAEELEAAKRYLTGAFALRFDSNAKIAGYLVFLQREGLGTEYLETRNPRIEAVTQDDIARVAARLLEPDALSVIVVGEPAGL